MLRFMLPLFFLLLGSGGIANAQPPATADHSDPAVARGAEILLPFKMQLVGTLQDALLVSAVEAVAVCKVEAPRIAAEFSVDGIEIGRTSHRLRNPDNTAPEWVAPVLQRYLDDDSFRQAIAMELPDDRIGYVEPLLVQPLCLTCHGSAVAEPLASEIARLYPDDTATGFALGELRGVAWAEFPQ